jgi:hypothetical protein
LNKLRFKKKKITKWAFTWKSSQSPAVKSHLILRRFTSTIGNCCRPFLLARPHERNPPRPMKHDSQHTKTMQILSLMRAKQGIFSTWRHPAWWSNRFSPRRATVLSTNNTFNILKS